MKSPTRLDPNAPDPYTVLGVTPAATVEEIKQSYFALVRAHPPEREPAVFKQVRAAYERLKTGELKLETDMLRLQEWPEPELESLPPLELTLRAADVIRAVRACSDLARSDWREDWREVKL
jgi:curved DNA-binding protein CbpA